MAVGPRAVVAGTTVTQPRNGLLSSATVIEGSVERWENGFAFVPDGCPGQGDIIDPCTPDTFTAPDNAATVVFDPFIVREGDGCGTIGYAVRDREARARRLLLASQSFHIAKEFWTGTWAKAQGVDNENRYLADPSSDVVTDGPSSVTDALACLEQGLAQCGAGQPGMIHATPQIVTLWQGAELLVKEGNQIQTILGTIVVADAGYDGSRWDGAPATDGSIWAYATGLVTVRLGAIETIPSTVAQATNRLTNDTEYQATRAAAVTWDGCCNIAAEINATLCGINGS